MGDIEIVVVVAAEFDLQRRMVQDQTEVDCGAGAAVCLRKSITVTFYNSLKLTLRLWTVVPASILLRWRTLRGIPASVSILRLPRTAIGCLWRLCHGGFQ